MQYGEERHEHLWREALEKLSRFGGVALGGNTDLIALRTMPSCMAVYAASLGAVFRRRWDNFRVVTIDAVAEDYRERRNMVDDAHP
ncbi:hypothetical protein GCM10009836_20400 [Pseudonocardia ailaonensis]|uniref:DUF1330 domain-containing protein n=1 Tax=Pseudonocardia ailaonensis TaxID=367279 RepID=A0ABN2MVV5_9PSEU